eukprot:scaffold3822_cov379-Prasinococcus_capsulatus_cf.AAC.1
MGPERAPKGIFGGPTRAVGRAYPCFHASPPIREPLLIPSPSGMPPEARDSLGGDINQWASNKEDLLLRDTD